MTTATRTPTTIAAATAATANPALAATIATRVGATGAYTGATGSYTTLTNPAGVAVARIVKSGRYIIVTAAAPDQCRDLPGEPSPASQAPGGWDVYLTRHGKLESGLGDRPGTAADLAIGAICGGCFMATPVATGVCENCA